MEQEIGIWDSVLLENLTEDNFISNLHQRYIHDYIYTYIGTSLIAINPFKELSQYSSDVIRSYGSKGIFQLPPHIYGLANLAYQSLKDQSEDQCIILTGESGSGKTESYKLIVHYLTQIQDAKKLKPQASSNCSRRRTSNSCPATTRFCSNNDGSRPPTPKRQSPIPYKIDKCSSTFQKTRSESSDRSTINKKLSRERIVDFDFSRHKSIENISSLTTCTLPTTATKSTMTPTLSSTIIPKSCFKHNHIDIVGRSKTNVDLNHRKSNSDLCKQIKINEIIVPNKICCNSGAKSKTATIAIIHDSKNIPINSCKACGHSKCLKQQKSLDEDIKLNQTLFPTVSPIHCSTTSIPASFIRSSLKPEIAGNPHKRGSCFNLSRQISNEKFSGDEFIIGDPLRMSSRISLIDAHKLGQKFVERELGTSCGLNTDRASSPGNYIWLEYIRSTKKFRDRVASADCFLEAMGNASTLKNNNSSRYGKFFDIEIDYKGDPIGVHVTHYLLEKTRITFVNHGERNFHIFYQLLLGADIQFLKSLKLYRNIEKYELLKNTAGNEDDKSSFHLTKKSLETLGLRNEEIFSIFRVIASVLKLGNFVFVPVTNIDGSEGCQVSNDYELQETAALLNLDAQILLQCLTKVSNVCTAHHDDSGGSELDARQASTVRNVLCRTLYSRLFTWLVNRINEALKSNQREKNLALLDFYGFELLESNLFEQLTINYCAEKIHQSFLQNVLKLEQEIYIKEGLDWLRIDYFDNESICELLDKPNYGLLSLLNESHINTDEALLVRIQQCCAGHPNFLTSGPSMTSTSFKIRHYANVVTYSIQGFLEKNSDILPRHISSGLYHSKLSLVQNLFPEGNPKRATKKPTSLSSNLRIQLQTLLTIIGQKNRRNHYVFCIKPNENKQSRLFDLALMQHQVRYMNLMPLVLLCRTGHCFHLTHLKFFNRYKLLNNLTWPHFNHGSLIEGIALIIRGIPLPSAEFTIGSKNVFIRSPRTVYEIEEFRKARLNFLAILIQKTFRMYINRMKYQKLRESQIIISSAWRTWRECRFGIPFTGRRHLWSLYRIARKEYHEMKYKKQAAWAKTIIYKHFCNWKIRQFLLTLPLRLPANTLSPLSLEWPEAPLFLTETSHLLYNIYHRWRCYIYRRSFDQTSRNRMREKVTASIIFKDRKASYPMSVAHPFVGDYVRLRHNAQWKKYCVDTNDQYVVFADIINKITRSSGKFVPVILVLSTSSMLLLDQRTLQVKYRVPAAEIYRLSLSPYLDDIAVFHIKSDSYCSNDHQISDSQSGCLFHSELGRRKGDFVFQTGHVIEIVTKLFLVIQNATAKPPEVHISTEFEANFGQQTVIFTFKYAGISELPQGQPKVNRRGNRMEIVV